MDYQKTYPITQNSGQKLLLRWTRGYREIELEYNERIVLTSQGIVKLKNGIALNDPELGKVELKLSDKPMMVDIIVDGYHSPSNNSHPVKQLKFAATYFWIIAVFALIGSLFEGIHLNFPIGILSIIYFFNLTSGAIYIVAAISTNKSKPWGFYLGFYTFCFWTLIAFLGLPFTNFLGIVIFIIRGVFLYFLITNIKHARGVSKHNRFENAHSVSSEELLDSKI